MIKTLLSVFLAFVALDAFAGDPPTYRISCGVKKHKTQGRYSVSAAVRGDVVGRSGKPYTLDDFSVGYTVFSKDQAGKDHVWTQETVTGRDLEADKDYDPSKYEGHVRFTLPSKKGKVQLIYPASLERAQRFQAVLQFTHINDHFGGKAVVHCTRRKVN